MTSFRTPDAGTAADVAEVEAANYYGGDPLTPEEQDLLDRLDPPPSPEDVATPEALAATLARARRRHT